MTKNGIYNWRQCSWTPDGELFSMGEQLMANVGYTSKEAANVAAANMPKSGPLNQIKPTSSLQDKNHEYLDPFQFNESSKYFDKKSKRENPRWDCVKTKYICEFKNMITLKELSETYTSEELTLVRKGNRLSIMPINKDIALELLIKLKKN